MTEPVFNVTPENFQTDVVQQSQSVPVVLLFWAAQVAPSADARRVLETQANAHRGKVCLGLVDVAADPTLAQHLRVQGLPSIRVVSKGQIVDQMEGPQTEAALTALIAELTQSPGELLRENLQEYVERGEYEQALVVLQQAISEEPDNQAFRVELADVLLLKGETEDARRVLKGIPAETDGRERPQTRLEMLEEAAGMGTLAEVTSALEAAPEDLDLIYKASILNACAGSYEAALEQAMSILRTDRTFREDIGRLTMLRIFQLLPKGAPLTQAYRRRMFAFMH